jgi:uncharacterized protein
VSDLERPGSTPRTRIRRLPHHAVVDSDALRDILDRGLVAHVGFVGEDGAPYVIPVAYARAGNRMLFHGSTASRTFRALGAGTPACATVTIIEGIVLARSAFESSMNYGSVMVLGRCEVVEGEAKLAALERISEHVAPGRWAELRPPKPQELKATRVLALPLDECSVKVNLDGPDDPPDDLDQPVWAGTVPLRRSWGRPLAAPDLRFDLPPPTYIAGWRADRV